jgi:hypothetical protein
LPGTACGARELTGLHIVLLFLKTLDPSDG